MYLAVFWTLITLAIFFFALNGKVIAIAMTLAASLHFLISEGIFKYLLVKYFKKVRPYIAFPDEIISIGRRHSDSSFPSSHMSANLSVLTVLVYFYPTIWPIAIIWTLFMAYARLHNGMHYLIDVVAGTVFGTIYGIIAIYFVNLFLN
jgi:undecaprenyl-diphosphatase